MDICSIQQTAYKALPLLYVLYFVEEEVAFPVAVVWPETVVGVQYALAIFKTKTVQTVILEVQVKQLRLVKTSIHQLSHLLATETGLSHAAHTRNDGRLALKNRYDSISAGNGWQWAILELQQYSL